jgi:hypothetical protein
LISLYAYVLVCIVECTDMAIVGLSTRVSLRHARCRDRSSSCLPVVLRLSTSWRTSSGILEVGVLRRGFVLGKVLLLTLTERVYTNAWL